MARKTHCRRGHEMTPENTYTRPSGDAVCKACRGMRDLARRAAAPRSIKSSDSGFTPIRAPGSMPLGFLPNYNFPKIKFCSLGHAIIDGNVIREGSWLKCRTCRRAHQKRTGSSGNLQEKTVRKVLEALRSGRTWSSLAGHHGNTYVPKTKVVNIVRLKIFCENNPKIGRLIRRLAEKNRIAVMSAPRGVAVTAPAILRAAHDVMDEIEAVLPRHLPRDLRDDVAQNIWLAVTERRLKREDIPKHAHAFIRAEYKSSHNAWGPRSLDVPIWIDGKTTLLDTLTSGSGLWD
jgi:hypothetical protein